MTIFNKSKKPTLSVHNAAKKTEQIAANLICILTFTAFTFIALYSVVQTSVIDPENYVSEKILYQSDNGIWNIILFMLFFVVFYYFGATYDFFAKVNMRAMEIAVTAVPLVLGLIWVLSVKTVPAADSANIFEAATGAAKGDYTAFLSNDQFYNHDFYSNNSYFNFYPFQLGFVFICEIIYKIFGTSTAVPLEILNVICCALSYLAIAKLAGAIFKRRGVEFITIVLLFGCFQPILFTAFPYGNIIGMCCALWASYFLVRYFDSGKYLLFIPITVLLTLATLAKYNNMIYLIAFAVVLLIHAIRAKKWQSLALILALAVACVGCSKLIIFSYEQRAQTKFTSGVSQKLYLDMGLNESWMAPGWYTKLGLETYLNSNFDTKAAETTASADIQKRLETFSSNPTYAYDFFSKKIISQWNEPTYESIWVSKVKTHYTEPTGFADSIYNQDFGKTLEGYFKKYMMLVFVLFSAGMLILILKKKADLRTMLLPLVLLGAFCYHLLFEGKSQYVLTYIILLLPYAAYCAMCIVDLRQCKLKAKASKASADDRSAAKSKKQKDAKPQAAKAPAEEVKA